MRYCCVRDCKANDSYKDISFYKFPKNYEKSWIEVAGRGMDWRPSPNTFMCSLHFKPSDRISKKLVVGARPFKTLSAVNVALGKLKCSRQNLQECV